MRNVKDAEANDMIHVGSDHRCIMATFLINTPGKNTHARRENKKHETIGHVEHEQKAMNTNIEMSELEERYQEIVDTIKKAAAKKGNEVHDTKNNAKDQVERKNAAPAAETESTLVEAVAQEIESRSMKRSSTVANQRGVPAQLEHRRQDGWTSTPRGSHDGWKGSKRVTTAGERLPKQRPHGDEHPEHNSEEHLGAQVPHQDEKAGSVVFHSSSNASEFKNDNKEAHVTTSAAAKENEEFLNKDAEILRLIEERRSTPKEEKQRLKDLSKRIKNCIRKKKE